MSPIRNIAVVTVGRSDYGIYLPVLRDIQRTPGLALQIIAAGMHLAPEFGRTVGLIAGDGFEIAECVDMLIASDTPRAIAMSMGIGSVGYAGAFDRLRPDIILVLGDRFEMHAAAVAALPFKIPVAHIHGGELTFGAIDDALRHSITKLSHLHFVTTPEYGRRVCQMGEEPWRVTVCGAPSLDNLTQVAPLSEEQLGQRIRLSLDPPPLLVTFHPTTLAFDRTEDYVTELLAALEQLGRPIVFTMPNADTSGRQITERIRGYVAAHPNAVLVDNLGTQAYFAMMRHATAMVGNSSSGIIEAASFRLPVVNIGSRQEGRVRGLNVIDAPNDRRAIVDAVRQATSAEFRQSLQDLVNPYDRGGAAAVITATLSSIPLDDRLLIKRFHDSSPAACL